jgi:hypothetical protein
VSPYSARTPAGSRDTSKALQLLRGHHHSGAGDGLAVQRRLDATTAAMGEGTLDDVEVADPRQLARLGRRRRHVGQAALRVVHLEGVELAAEEPAPARPLAGQDRDVPGDVRPVDGQLVAADRPDRGVLDRRVGR